MMLRGPRIDERERPAERESSTQEAVSAPLARFPSPSVTFRTALARLSIGVLLLAAIACASPYKVHSRAAATARLGSLVSYDWLPREEQALPDDPRIDEALLHARIRRAVDDQLVAKGYLLAPVREPGFLVTYHASLDGRRDFARFVDTSRVGYRTWTEPMRYEELEHEYDVGTLIVDVVHPTERRLLWRAIGQVRVNLDEDAYERGATLRELVERMLADFPSR